MIRRAREEIKKGILAMNRCARICRITFINNIRMIVWNYMRNMKTI